MSERATTQAFPPHLQCDAPGDHHTRLSAAERRYTQACAAVEAAEDERDAARRELDRVEAGDGR